MTGPRKKAFQLRSVGALVSEIHRILLQGGVYINPCDDGNRKIGGKLRLLYEINPMSFIIEQAGGKASTGRAPILSLIPHHHHQRAPMIVGSIEEVDLLERYHRC